MGDVAGDDSLVGRRGKSGSHRGRRIFGGGVAICERPTGEFGYRDGRRNGKRTPAWWREEAECGGEDAGGGNGDEISRNVVCNRKFNRREPGNSAGGERKRRARESEKTSRRREREGENARRNYLRNCDSVTRVGKWLTETGAGGG